MESSENPEIWRPLMHWTAQPRWPLERIVALPGRCRGVLLRDWAESCQRRFGRDAPDLLRATMGALGEALPDRPGQDDWLPAAVQVAVNDAIIDGYLHGNAAALEPLLREDAGRDLTRMHRILARAMGPAAAYKRVQGLYRRIYDAGQVRAESGDDGAQITCLDAALFGNPTWRSLQMFGHRAALLILTGKDDAEVLGADAGPEGFAIRLRWR